MVGFANKLCILNSIGTCERQNQFQMTLGFSIGVLYTHKCQFGCGILKMAGSKMQDFFPKIDMLEGNCFKTILWWMMVSQKVPKSHFQSQFSMSKIKGIFSKKKYLRLSI